MVRVSQRYWLEIELEAKIHWLVKDTRTEGEDTWPPELVLIYCHLPAQKAQVGAG